MAILSRPNLWADSFADMRRNVEDRIIQLDMEVRKLMKARGDFEHGIIDAYSKNLSNVMSHDHIPSIISGMITLLQDYRDAYTRMTEDNVFYFGVILDIAEIQHEAYVRNLLNENHLVERAIQDQGVEKTAENAQKTVKMEEKQRKLDDERAWTPENERVFDTSIPVVCHVEESATHYVPWQRCPICYGTGQIFVPNQTIPSVCNVCFGRKIIPMHSPHEPRITPVEPIDFERTHFKPSKILSDKKFRLTGRKTCAKCGHDLTPHINGELETMELPANWRITFSCLGRNCPRCGEGIQIYAKDIEEYDEA